MRSRTTKRFRRQLANLPSEIRQQARSSYRRFRENPRHPSLRFKKVHPSAPVYAARISFSYRAVGVLQGEEIIWFFIGSHAEYELLLRSL